LVGHNGCGKSTLAKLLNALLVPKDGKVYVYGMDTADAKNLFNVRKTVGMVFQNPDNQMVASIVEEDVAFGPENLGVPPEEIRERVDWALKSVGMSEYAARTPQKLSGGQKQRIAIAGSLAIKPKVLVLDESTAMLDPVGRSEVLSVAHKLNEEGITIILITHFMEEVLSADRVVVMNKARVVMQGAPMEIFARQAELEEIGLKVPRTIELARSLNAKGFQLNDEETDARALGEAICQSL
ncbi:MAG: energy-coupling factor transporter ATPase, partial [Clostridia bacterium]